MNQTIEYTPMEQESQNTDYPTQEEIDGGSLAGSVVHAQGGVAYFEKLLGAGSFGWVYKAAIGQWNCAVKVVPYATEDEQYALDEEWAILQRLSGVAHPNIVNFEGCDFMRNAPLAFLMFELVPHGDLCSYVEKNQGLAFEHAMLYYEQLLDGIAFLHSKNIYHRDIKPENVLMMSIDQVKITDFGLARICEGIDPLFANDAGTASYLPPEVYRSGFYHGSRGDLWAAAITLVFMCTARLPWEVAIRSQDDDFKRFCWGLALEGFTQSQESFIRSLLDPAPAKRLIPPVYKNALKKYCPSDGIE